MPAPATAMPCESNLSCAAAAPFVWRLAPGVVDVPVSPAALTYEYEVRVTTETPPPGRVDVYVPVTSVEERDVLVLEAWLELVVDWPDVWVERVVPSLLLEGAVISGQRWCPSWLAEPCQEQETQRYPASGKQDC